ncbi:AAA family ATPase [Thermodesulfobacteriota bacterium]
MYLSYYNLKAEPFTISADPKFLWLGKKHKEAFATLKYGILGNKGFLLLTGDVGTGKTTLINALVNSLKNKVLVATVQDPGLQKLDFFNYIAAAFKSKKNFKSKGTFISYFSLFLRLAYDKNKKVLLIIDEAQRLNSDLLEEIRLLSNIEKQHTKLINIFFVGQDEFNEVLSRKENRALRQRISLIHNLQPLNRQETEEYIKYRLQIAGSNVNIFNSAAAEEIYSFSGGYPRLINIICDYALLTGYVKAKKEIKAQIIRECAEELRIPNKSYEKENRRQEHFIKPNSKNIGDSRKKTTWRKLRYIIPMTLVSMTAGFFYFQPGLDGPVVTIKKYWAQVIKVIQNKKLTSRAQTEQNLKNKPYLIKYPENLNSNGQQEVPIESQPRQESMSKEKEFENYTGLKEYNNADSTAAKVPGEDVRSGIKKKTLDKTDERIGFKEHDLIIYFDYNSYKLNDEGIIKLDRLLSALAQHPDTDIMIRGYTDNTGDYISNKRLSEMRASTVKSYLVGKGIRPGKTKAFGIGPISRDDIEKSSRMNRRVEIELIPTVAKVEDAPDPRRPRAKP